MEIINDTVKKVKSYAESANLFNVWMFDVVTALVKVINKRMPSKPITKQEIIDRIKQDLGL